MATFLDVTYKHTTGMLTEINASKMNCHGT